ncbi:MAG: right-handed parallel beta-helix repeat-containing protein [Eubacterium sp.]|nr:right-handed parallel beta-helix repeat-containing protein [Eubacterium sp.]
MQGKKKYIGLLILCFVGIINCSVMGYTGNGKSGTPYVVSNEADLKTILTTKGKKSWVYVGINKNITLTGSIAVGTGKFRVYAVGANRTIQRSGDATKAINKKDEPKYCFRLSNATTMELGYGTTNYQLILDGNRSQFTGSKKSSGWLMLGAEANVTITGKCVIQNVINNEGNVNGSPINCRGQLMIYGEMKNCTGDNGGAIKTTNSGSLTIGNGAKIHHCTAESEGGAIHIGDDSSMFMDGGEIYQCTAKEEGGGIFATSGSYCEIRQGKIYHNTAGGSGGGVFSGMGAQMTIGDFYQGESGPEIYENTAAGSGGGVRCNGGTSNNSGGTACIYGSLISKNKSGEYGGGIACANASSTKKSYIVFANVKVEENTADKNGGGIWLGEGVKGLYGETISMTTCIIRGNVAGQKAGGLKISSDMIMKKNTVSENTAGTDGGGMLITEKATLLLESGEIKKNRGGSRGDGIYLMGKLQMKNTATVNGNNEVFLRRNTFIEVIGALSRKNMDIAYIDSEEKENGTKLVWVNYQSATGATELYQTGTPADEYASKETYKRFTASGLREKQCLRSCESVEGYDKRWIIISEKYTISYVRNTDEPVSNLPDSHIKFWNEPTNISRNQIGRNGYQTKSSSHWNLSQDGTGEVYPPGAVLRRNQNLIFYAQWEIAVPKELFLTATDRYYVVGQQIVLNKEEVLRKVWIHDDLNSDTNYSIKVLAIKTSEEESLAEGEDVRTENYLTTEREGEYILLLEASEKNGKLRKQGELHLFIMDAPRTGHQVRFISATYFYTLAADSRWAGPDKPILARSLASEKGKLCISLSGQEMKIIKETVRKNDYKITSQMNQKLMKQYGGSL